MKINVRIGDGVVSGTYLWCSELWFVIGAVGASTMIVTNDASMDERE